MKTRALLSIAQAGLFVAVPGYPARWHGLKQD